jgi:cell division protein FtsI (penicillin-binding protein 3)
VRPDAQQEQEIRVAMWRPLLLLACFTAMAAVLLWRALDLQIMDREFLQGQGEARHLRTVEITAHRGVIVDRHGEPLALSSPVDSVWAHPGYLLGSGADLTPLARALNMQPKDLRQRLQSRAEREFVYLRRHLTPEHAQQVMDLQLPGVSLQREYRRFYPAGEVTAHLLGFTNIDERGQEGIELAFEQWLRGESGAKRVLRDRLGRIIRDVESLREPRPGQSLTLSIDRRLQYLAYRELKAAAQEHSVVSASLVLLDVHTGEVLAMVNQPSYNPNNRSGMAPAQMRNRAITDSYEPGSTVKPLAVAAALEAGSVRPDSVIQTSPGVMRVGRHTVRDIRNYGSIDVRTVLEKSSTVGATKIALQLEPELLWSLMARLGFGVSTGSGFPGEAAGSLPVQPPQRDIERATLAYGYGLSTTPLQLAQAYATLAADGLRRPVSLLKRDEPPAAERVIDAEAARALREMLVSVTGPGGTARSAALPGYRIAGKTGTAKKSIAGGYADDRYVALFAGFAPASRPRLAMVVVMDEPRGDVYYGGQVAAPVFGKVMAGALRLLNIAPDDLPALEAHVAARGVTP